MLRREYKMLNLDDTMHLHVGYYENGLDYEGVFFKSVDSGKWLLFFDHESYGVTLKKYDHLELLVGKYIIEDDQIEKEGNKLFECFLKENDIVK